MILISVPVWLNKLGRTVCFDTPDLTDYSDVLHTVLVLVVEPSGIRYNAVFFFFLSCQAQLAHAPNFNSALDELCIKAFS